MSTDERRLELIEECEAILKCASEDDERLWLDLLAILREQTGPTTEKDTNTMQLPTVTFRPWTPERPTLDQMPDWTRHKCVTPSGNVEWAIKVGCFAYNASTTALARYEDSPNRFTVHDDTTPPTPKTLADVPVGVWCWYSHGGVVGGIVTKNKHGHAVSIYGDIDPGTFAESSADFEITRVLGFPIFNP